MALFDKFKQLDMEECKNWLMLGIDDFNTMGNIGQAADDALRKAEQERVEAVLKARKREEDEAEEAEEEEEEDA